MPVKTHHYNNDEITIAWKPDICIHSKICWHGLREVFDPARRPWIVPTSASSEAIMAQIDKCPSGALSYTKNSTETENKPAEKPADIAVINAANIVECAPNGPLLIRGEVLVKMSDGREEKKEGVIALCRCGGSQNKPYCDGAHRNNGFTG